MASTPKDGAARPPAWFRMRFLAVVAAVSTLVVVLLALLGPDYGIGRDFRFLVSTGVILSATTFAVLFGGFSRRVRGLVALAVVVAVGTLVLSVRRVHFDGALRPVGVDWRWLPEYDQLLARHRDRQALGRDAGPVRLAGDPACAEYRGARRDGISQGPKLARDWKTQPPKLLWQQPIGGGYAGFAAIGEFLVTIEQRGKQEVVACYEAATGLERWRHAYDALFSEVQGGDGPRATPTIAQGDVISLGATGILKRLDGATGREKWSVDMLRDNGTKNLMWGMSGSPLVFDHLVIVNPGVGPFTSNGGVVAYSIDTGNRIWTTSEPHRAGYSSPMVADLVGQRQVLIFDGDGVAGLEPKTGQQFWRAPWNTNQGINVAQPIPLGTNRVFVASGYLVGGGVFKLSRSGDAWSVERVWKQRDLQCKFSSAVLVGDYLYGLSNEHLACQASATGKLQWKARSEYGYGQLVCRDDLLLVLTETGAVVLVEARPDRFAELGRLDVFGEKTWNTPTLVGNRLYVRNHRQMAAIELPLASAGSPSP